MLWHKAQGAGGAGGAGGIEISYIGSVVKEAANGSGWDSPAEAINVLSIAEDGDLVVLAFTFDRGTDADWSFEGMAFTTVVDGTLDSTVGHYIGYHFVQPGDSNPYLKDIGSNFVRTAVVASVFRDVGSYLDVATSTGGTGIPNPPLLVADGDLWVAVGHLDDDNTTMLPPSGYSFGGAASVGSFGTASSTATAYKIASLSSDNPGPFSSNASDAWRAATLAFSAA
jgi:hypothetical protein